MAIPTVSGGIFNFTEGGYNPPTFSGGVYNFEGGELHYVDLGATISGVSVGEFKDLCAYIKSTIQATKNLGAYTKPFTQSYKNLGAAIRREDAGTKDLGASLTPELFKSTADIQGIINVIEIRDLPAQIEGIFFAGQKDLGAIIPKIFSVSQANLGAFISSKFIPFNLPAYLNVISYSDLPAIIKSTIQSTLNLGAYIGTHLPANLTASVNGILFKGEKDLGAILSGVYGPYDLQAYLRVHPYSNLPTTIHGWYGGIKDLRAVLGGWQTADLGAYIGAISAANLSAYINAIGKLADLGATIIPKTIRMKRALLISLLEHKDLAATINFQCFASRYSDLNAYFETIYDKKDLPASIWGMRSPTDYHDLRAYINAAGYDVQDTYTIRFIPEVRRYTRLRLNFRINYLQRDLTAYISGVVSPYSSKDLIASLTGVLTSSDLGASIMPIIQSNYTELPDWIWPKTHEIVIDFDHHWRERWRRTVELLFRHDGADPYHYFYVSGNQQVYRLDRSRHWTIWAHSYVETDDIIERRNIRRKYIFKMSDYNTIDEAIRDIIDRVSTYRQTDLNASITSIMPNYKDLSASVKIIAGKRTWVKSLRATITVIP
jgi:hypothetical protein